MSGLEIVGLVLASCDAVLTILNTIKRRKNAYSEIPGLIEKSTLQVKRISDMLKIFGDSSEQTHESPSAVLSKDLSKFPKIYLEKLRDRFANMKADLEKFKDSFLEAPKLKIFLSSQKAFTELGNILECLGPLERGLDIYGLLAHSHELIEKGNENINSAMQNLATSAKVDIFSDKVEKMMALLQQSEAVGLNDRCNALPKRAHELFYELSMSGLSYENKQKLSRSLWKWWDVWKIKPEDVYFKRRRNRNRAKLGGSTLADVYRATLTQRMANGKPLGEPLRVAVAVKELKVESKDLEREKPEFFREVFLQMDSDHPCILKTYGGFWPESDEQSEPNNQDDSLSDDEDEKVPFIVLELMTQSVTKALEGELLTGACVQRKVLRDVAHALAYLHGRGIVHRDIKPGNVLIQVENKEIVGHAKVADFGVSRRVQRAGLNHSYARTGVAAGTVCFMPPEVLADVNGCVSRRSWDIWSFGMLACNISAAHWKSKIGSVENIQAKSMAISGELHRLAEQLVQSIEDEFIRSAAMSCLRSDFGSRESMESVASFLDAVIKSFEGDACGQYELSSYYMDGRIVEENVEKAKIWLRKAAEAGHLGAAQRLDQLN